MQKNYKDLMQELREQIEQNHRALMAVVDSFNASEAVEPINYAQLHKFPLMEWVTLNEKVRVRKRNNRFNDYLQFDTEMETGGQFGEHFHDDIIESTEVVSGEMLDVLDGKTYKEGDVAHYDKGHKHTPIAIKKTLLHVLFKK